MTFLVTGGTGFIGWRVVRNLLARGLPVVVADWAIDREIAARLAQDAPGLPRFETCDISDFHDVIAILRRHPDITHAIHLAYLMSAEVEANPHLGARVNVTGMVNLFEAALEKKLARLVFTSSETVYGASQEVYGARPVTEHDYCSPEDHHFTYGIMKILNEFMGRKYVRNHGLSIACTRPPVVFGHGRKRGSVLWAEQIVSAPATRKAVSLPFPSAARDCWLYVDDCAEQLVRLALKPELGHFAYNNGGHTVAASEFAAMVRRYIPDAEFTFNESAPGTPLVEETDGSRLAREIGFTPRPLSEGILAHINEARAEAGIPAIPAAQGAGR